MFSSLQSQSMLFPITLIFHRQIENLEDLLKEKDNQVDMARARLTAMQAHRCSSEGALSSLEEAIGDKEKQMATITGTEGPSGAREAGGKRITREGDRRVQNENSRPRV